MAAIREIVIENGKAKVKLHDANKPLLKLLDLLGVTAGNNPLAAPQNVDAEEQQEIDDIVLARKIAYFLEITCDKIESQEPESADGTSADKGINPARTRLPGAANSARRSHG